MSADKKDKSIFIKCECEGEGMGVDYDAQDGLYYFSYWNRGFSSRKLALKSRIRYCWHTLTKGKAFNDEVLLSQDSVEELIDFLLGYKRLPKEKIDKLIETLNKSLKKDKNKK